MKWFLACQCEADTGQDDNDACNDKWLSNLKIESILESGTNKAPSCFYLSFTTFKKIWWPF